MNLGSALLAGLAVTSHHSGALGTVTMDGVQWADEVKAGRSAAGQHVHSRGVRAELDAHATAEQGRNRRWDD